jgi:hypothetical protein
MPKPAAVDRRGVNAKARSNQATLERERFELAKVHAEEHKRQLFREYAEGHKESCHFVITPTGRYEPVCKTGPNAFSP